MGLIEIKRGWGYVGFRRHDESCFACERGKNREMEKKEEIVTGNSSEKIAEPFGMMDMFNSWKMRIKQINNLCICGLIQLNSSSRSQKS